VVKVTWGLDNIDSSLSSITTLGSFDGVHLGHIKIIEELLEHQRQLGIARSVVVTFHPHPQQVLRKHDSSVQLLTTIDERLELLSKTGVDEVVVIKFTPEFSKKTYVEFFESILLKQLNTKAMVVGFNHAFGKNREGDTTHLEELGKKFEVPIYEVAPCLSEWMNISSTRIRNALFNGDLVTANTCLGRHYELNGVVVLGDRIGTTLGYPTANLKVAEEKLLPGDGVYCCRVNVRGRSFAGALSIGNRPTVGKDLERQVEVFLLDFAEDIYGATISVECIELIRNQQAFASLIELREQIERDVTVCRGLLRVEPASL